MAQKNPRRLVIRIVRDAIAHARVIVNRWDVRANDYDWDGPRDEHGNVQRVARRHEDFPENQVEAWQRLSRDAAALARIFVTIQGYADRQAADLLDTGSES